MAGAATYVYGELITGNGTALKPLAEVDDDDGSVTIEPHSAISYAACVIDVEVDDETGETTVLKMLQVYDVGRAINPTLVEGQIEGGAMMGLGLGLLEELPTPTTPPSSTAASSSAPTWRRRWRTCPSSRT